MSCTTERGTYNFPAIKKGETFLERDITIEESAGTTLASAELSFRLAGVSTTALEKTTSDGLEIVTATAGGWVIRIEAFVVTLTAGTYVHELWTTDADGADRNYVSGTMQVLDSNP